MIKLIAVLSILASSNAIAATCWMDTVNHRVNWVSRPDAATIDGVSYYGFLPDEMLASAGWVRVTYEDCAADDRAWGWAPSPWARKMTQAERDALDAKIAAEQEQAEALSGPSPEVLVPALDDDGNPIGTARLVVRAATWELVPLTNSASPQRIWAVQRAEFTNKIARMDAKKAAIKEAKGKGNGLSAVAGRVNALESERGVE